MTAIDFTRAGDFEPRVLDTIRGWLAANSTA
jgi:hypothetical protein